MFWLMIEYQLMPYMLRLGLSSWFEIFASEKSKHGGECLLLLEAVFSKVLSASFLIGLGLCLSLSPQTSAAALSEILCVSPQTIQTSHSCLEISM